MLSNDSSILRQPLVYNIEILPFVYLVLLQKIWYFLTTLSTTEKAEGCFYEIGISCRWYPVDDILYPVDESERVRILTIWLILLLAVEDWSGATTSYFSPLLSTVPVYS